MIDIFGDWTGNYQKLQIFDMKTEDFIKDI